MTRERFEQIKTAAMQMVDEMEFADFVDVNLVALVEWHNVFHRMIADPFVLILIRRELKAMFEVCEQQYQRIPDDQEIEQQGAALVQYALRGVLINEFPQSRLMVRFHLRTKFRRIPEPLILAPGDMRVPSLAQQRPAGGGN